MNQFQFFVVVSAALMLTTSCTTTEEAQLQEVISPELKSITIGEESFDLTRAEEKAKSDFTAQSLADYVFIGKLEVIQADIERLYSNISAAFSPSQTRIETSGNPVATVIYTNRFSSRMNHRDIVGISALYPIEGGYHHKLFLPKDNGLEESASFSLNVSTFSTFDFDVLLTHLAGKDRETNTIGYILIVSNSIQRDRPSNTTGRTLETLPSLSSELLVNPEIIDPIAIYAANGCSCPPPEEGGCVYDEYGEGVCEFCAFEQVAEISDTHQINYAVYEEHSMQEAYNMRDEYMKGTPLGDKYIKFYYKLSYFMDASGALTSDNFWDHIALLDELYIAAGKLRNGPNSAIIVTPALFNTAMNLINEYRGLTDSWEIHAILTEIENDLRQNYGLTKQLVESPGFIPVD